jgi:hypothetical protein
VSNRLHPAALQIPLNTAAHCRNIRMQSTFLLRDKFDHFHIATESGP